MPGKKFYSSFALLMLTPSFAGPSSLARTTKQLLAPLRTPIHGLPVELLSLIFELVVLADGSVAAIVLVCRSWWQIALYTSKLWTRVLVSADIIPPALKTGSSHACQTQLKLQTVLAASGNSLIELTYIVGPIQNESPTPQTRSELYHAVGPHLARASFVCIILNSGVKSEIVSDSFQNAFAGNLSGLQSLMIASAYPVSGLLSLVAF